MKFRPERERGREILIDLDRRFVGEGGWKEEVDGKKKSMEGRRKEEFGGRRRRRR